MTSSPEPPLSPRESETSEKTLSGSEVGEGENLTQEVQLTYKDEFANEVLVFTSLDDFHEGIRMTRTTENEEGGASSGDLFECVVQFPPGRHLYRYLVDGEWMCDEIKEVTYLQGNAYNEIEVEQQSALMSKSALKKKEKRKKWRQKKKIAKARRRALETIGGDGKTDPNTQNKQMAETLKSIESSTQHKLVQAEESFAKEKEELKTKMRSEREEATKKVQAAKDETANVQKELAQLKQELSSLEEKNKAMALESQQGSRRAQGFEQLQASWGAEKSALEKKEREAQEENNNLRRKMKTLRTELQTKFEKQIEEVTAAMEAELRNTSVNIFYLKKEIEKHTQAEQQASEQTKSLTQALEVLKKEKDDMEIKAASSHREVGDLSQKMEQLNVATKELEATKEQLAKLTEKHKNEVATFTQKAEEFKRIETALTSEKQSLSEGEAKGKEEIKKLRDQNYQLQTELTTSQAKFDLHTAELRSKLQAEVEGTRAELSEEQKKMQTHLQDKDSALQNTASRLEELKKERDQLIANHEKETKHLSDKLKNLGEEKEKLEKELSTVRGEAAGLTEAKKRS